MPKFSYECLECGYIFSITANSRPEGDPDCASCGGEAERMITGASTVLKGASESNNYYVPPSNADLGLESDLTTSRKSTQRAEDYLEQEDKDAKRDWDRQKQKRARERQRTLEKMKSKNPKLYEQFKRSLERGKEKVRDKKDMGI